MLRSAAVEGSFDAPLVVLAESPGAVEILKARPLIGPSGEVFERLLRKAELRREDVLFVNTWPWRVQKEGSLILSPRGHVLWDEEGFTPEGLEEAQPALDLIRQSTAHVILTLGQQACALATGHINKIAKRRGSVYAGLDRIGNRKVIPTLHPAATLHGTYLWQYHILADLKKAWLETPRLDFITRVDRKHLIWPTFHEALGFIEACRLAGIVATDIEVINHQVYCFSLCYDITCTMTVPLMDAHGDHVWSAEEEAAIWNAYSSLLANPEVVKVNQNLVGFDAPFLFQQNGIHTCGTLHDTMIAQRVLYHEFPSGLDFISSIYTSEPYYKDEGKLWKNAGSNLDEFLTYCGKDAAVSLEAWWKLESELRESGMWETYEMTTTLANPLMYMTKRGVAINRIKLEETKVKIEAELVRLEAELLTHTKTPLNPNSPKQCAEYFYSKKGITPYIGASGNPTTDDKAMSRILRKYNLPEARLVQELRKLKKLHGTYIEVVLDDDDRLRCSWNPRGTWTGRLSSSQTIFGTGLNMQNLHPQFKGFIVSEEAS